MPEAVAGFARKRAAQHAYGSVLRNTSEVFCEASKRISVMLGFVEPRCSIGEKQSVWAVVQDCGVRCDDAGVAMVVVDNVICCFGPGRCCWFIDVDEECVLCIRTKGNRAPRTEIPAEAAEVYFA